MRFGRSVARNWSRAGVRQRLVAARRLVVGSACRSTGESWRSLGHTVGRVTVCLLPVALFSLRLGEPCDRGQRERLTQRLPLKKTPPSSSSSCKICIARSVQPLQLQLAFRTSTMPGLRGCKACCEGCSLRRCCRPCSLNRSPWRELREPHLCEWCLQLFDEWNLTLEQLRFQVLRLRRAHGEKLKRDAQE